MAGWLRKKMSPSTTLYVNDVDKAALDRFVNDFSSHGSIEVVASAKEVATKADTVFTILPLAKHVRAVYLNENTGIIAAPKNANRLCLECSTIDIATTRDVGKQIMDAGLGTYVDSPVSGAVSGAQKGILSFLVGHPGAPESDPMAARIKKLVTMMGAPEKLNFCGSIGTGLASKITNNYLSCSTLLLVAEAMAMGLRYGVDKMTLYNCVKSSSGHSWLFDNMQPCPGVIAHSPASNNFAPSFKPYLLVKDVTLAVDAAKEVGIDATMGETALKMYQKAADDPRTADLDCTSVWLHVNQELK